MKFRMILSALLLPTVVAAQQTTVKGSIQPYRVIAIQPPVASFQAEGALPPTAPVLNDSYTLLQDNKVVPNITLTLPQEKAQEFTYILPAGDQVVYTNTLFAPQAQSKVRVNLNLRNAPLKEAVKQLTEQTKLEFVLEKDVPDDARVTLVAKNIRLSTALDMLADATDMKWGRKAVKKADSKESGIAYHIGKNVTSSYSQWPNASFLRDLNSSPDNKLFQRKETDKNFNLYYQELLQKDGSPTYKVVPKLEWSPNIILKNQYNTVQPLTQTLKGSTILQTSPSNLSTTYSLGNTLLNTVGVNEVRSTFTCPHCKQQVTVLHKHESPKCEKCGRAFHDDWQFCPFDGAKRPAVADTDWQFCPICGKSLKPDGKEDIHGKGDIKVNAKGGN